MAKKSKASITKKKTVKQQTHKKKEHNPVGELLAGTKKPPNEFIGYLVEKARSSKAEFTQVMGEYERAKAAVAGLTQRLSELQGKHNSYITDIEHWLDQEQNKR